MTARHSRSSAERRISTRLPASVRGAARRLGITTLHAEQEQVVAGVLAGQDVLMILPTGFGKSACYQIPSMILPEPVVLISPLLALLRDQQQHLEEHDVPCVRLDGTVRGRARRLVLDRLAEGGPLLVMTTPETLESPEARKALTQTGVGLVAVDEAHCISEWGHDFRPAYLRLGRRIRSLGAPPVLALTATAAPRVRGALIRSLGMRDPVVVASSPHRSNLAFEVIRCGGDERLRALVRLIRRLRRPGIIYCATRREVELVHGILRRFGLPSHRYHGGMTARERNLEQELYMRPGRRTVMVATNAFGLGIDKPDIRYVLHAQAPASLEQYVQEAGRAGRDGRRSNCILLHDPADRRIYEALLARSRVRPEQLYRLGDALAAWREEERNPSVEALALSAELGTRVTSALLVKVEEAGLVSLENSEVCLTATGRALERDTRSLAGQFETLRTQDSRRLDTVEQYVASGSCRAVFLRGYFGEEPGEPCGLCDVCRGSPSRPSGFFDPLMAPTQTRKRPPRERSSRGGRRSDGRSGRKKRGRRGRRSRSRKPRDPKE